MREGWRHFAWLIIICLTIGLVYAKVTGAYFCSYDDFMEIHRAAFEHSRQPSKVFTSSHFGSYKYRPLAGAITLVTYSVARDNPLFFRSRNIGFHLVNVTLVYALGWLLFRSSLASGMGAAVFGLHPLSNQTIIGAVWPSTINHAGFLLALVLFIISVRSGRLWALWLIAAIVSGWLSVLSHESNITVFGLMCVYPALHFVMRRERLLRWQFIVVFGGVSGALLCAYFLVRRLVVPDAWQQIAANVPSFFIAVKNALMSIVALLSPIDAVLANEWLHTPLPSEMVINHPIVIVFAGSALLVALSLLTILWLAKSRRREINWVAVVFLISGILLPLLPVLVFQSHPSETYLYLSVAFYGLLASYILVGVVPANFGRRGVSTAFTIVVLIIGFFATATSVRNGRVYQCGETARQILSSLPQLREGSWKISFANIVGEEASRRYGFYGFRGIDVINGGGSGEEAITRALQLVYKNESLSGEIVQSGELIDKCGASRSYHHICLWVHSDGRVEPYLKRVSLDRAADAIKPNGLLKLANSRGKCCFDPGGAGDLSGIEIES